MQATTVVTIVVVGLMVGVELAVAAFVNPIFDRLPEDCGLAARSDGARVLGRVMPFWYIGSLVLATAWAVMAWGDAQAVTIAVAAGLLLVSVLMSVVLLVPINSRSARWSPGQAPADWKQQRARWDFYHHFRVAVIIAAFALLVIAGVH
ncbi:MAG TPA: DUF1772 domain-containing protein [Arthrobacter sp.]|nr:DUF1772 domain-containing protein [Arthrobacter sp.]